MTGAGHISVRRVAATAIILAGLLMQAPAAASPEATAEETSTRPEIGFCLVSWADPPLDHWLAALGTLRSLGVEHITVVTYRFNAWDEATERCLPQISTESEHGHTRPDTSTVAAVTGAAAAQGMSVTLSPFVEIDSPEGIGAIWRGKIGFQEEQDLATWFDSYSAYILELATVAEAQGADRFMIGSELQGLSTDRRAAPYWKRLIEQVRDVFTGRLSYAANWQWEYPNVRFWGKLDEIGIDAYFELLPADQCLGPSHPSRNALIREWRKHLRNVEKLANAKGLPVLFSEIGYTDLDGTVAEPWKHETSDRLDVLERVAAYSALAEATATQRTWLREIHFWHWGMTGTSGSRYRVSLGDGVSDFLWRWQSGTCSVRPSDEGSETEEGRAEAP